MADDLDKLSALLADDRTSDEDREAFKGMKKKLIRSPKAKLSRPQAQWVEDVYKRLELDAAEGSRNLFSSGKVKAEGKSSVTFPWERPGYVKPLKPPGRK